MMNFDEYALQAIERNFRRLEGACEDADVFLAARVEALRARSRSTEVDQIDGCRVAVKEARADHRAFRAGAPGGLHGR
ncbi:MAG TPA: hypothetical protein VKT49_18685 [Bryobacteraceae bacterium]|nr:hypothetical protein [Bryobacteraceae bacterium]